MKKTLFLGLAILLFAGLFLMACSDDFDEVIMGDFSLKVSLDKTRARSGDKVTATVTFKNLSGKDIEAELPDWIAAEGGQTKEDILSAVFLTEGSEWGFNDILFGQPLPKIVIESGAVIEKNFEYIIKGSSNLRVQAGAFFISKSYPTYHEGKQIESKTLKVRVN